MHCGGGACHMVCSFQTGTEPCPFATYSSHPGVRALSFSEKPFFLILIITELDPLCVRRLKPFWFGVYSLLVQRKHSLQNAFMI